MNLLLDTNILLYFTKGVNFQQKAKIINPDNQKIFLSVVTVGEIKSISLQNNWGVWRMQTLNEVLDEIIIIEINENLIDTYAEIDAFSQCRNPSFRDYQFVTPRNMGKNDLWG